MVLAADNKYTKAMCIRRWAKQGVALLTPVLKWVKGCYAQAYHGFIKEPGNAERLRRRGASVEPLLRRWPFITSFFWWQITDNVKVQ